MNVARAAAGVCVSANPQVKAFSGFRGAFSVYTGIHLFEIMSVL